MGKLFLEVRKLFWQVWSGHQPTIPSSPSARITECEEIILPAWSPPDDPAKVLEAEGRLNPGDDNEDDLRYKGGSGRRSTVIQFKQTFRSFKGGSW